MCVCVRVRESPCDHVCVLHIRGDHSEARAGGLSKFRYLVPHRSETGLLKYRVIHKSFRNFRPLRYSSRDVHAEGEHVNRGRETKKTWRDSLPIDMLFSAVSVLVVAQPNSEFPEGLMNYPVYPGKETETA
jgi:hypothetical protein